MMAGMRVRLPLVTPVRPRQSAILHQEIAQPGRARARGARGRGIEARYPDHLEKHRFSHSFRADRRRLSTPRQKVKSQLMRVSVAIRATGSSAISRRQILARFCQAKPGLALISVMVSRSVWDREGGGSSPPWVTIFSFPLPRESPLSFGSSNG